MAHFVTMTSQSYAMGTAVLIRSILQNGGIDNPRWTILQMGLLDNNARSWIDKALDGCDVRFVSVDELPQITWTGDISQERRRLLFHKLSVFCLEPCEKSLFIDSDIICVGDITALADATPFSAVTQMGNTGPIPINHRPMFNTGVYVFQPDRSMFEHMREWVARNITGKLPLGDQWILNNYLYYTAPDSIHLLDLRYNVLQGLSRYGRLWNDTIKDARLFHFTSYKPWEARNSRSMTFYDLWVRYRQELVK